MLTTRWFTVPKTIDIDKHSHNILVEAKKEMKRKGYGNPTLSDAIRWLHRSKKSCEEG